MKKIIFVLMMVFVGFGACEYEDLVGITVKPGTIENYDFKNNIPIFNTEKEAMHWIDDFLKFEYDKDIHNQKEYWQTPEETYNLRTGDCEDSSLLLMYILENQFDETTYLTCYFDGYSNHAIVYVKELNIYIDPTLEIYHTEAANKNIERTIKWSYIYEEALWFAVNYHDNL